MSKLALLGGDAAEKVHSPQMPSFDKEAINHVVSLLQRGETVGLGRTNNEIARAEEAVSQYHSGRHALVVNSGQSALSLALMGLEIGYGDEVITTPYTWGASSSCILACGAIPVFVDVDPITGLLDPDAIEPAITDKTKAVLVVHLYGQPADMHAINKVAKKHDLFVVEDGSQAHGASINDEVVGNFGDAGGFSCMGGKLLATAEAGYMVTDNEDIFWKASLTAQHYGRAAELGFPEEYKQYTDNLVLTYRLSPIIASLFPSQIEKLPEQTNNRRKNVEHFSNALAGCPLVTLPDWPEHMKPAWHFVTMNVNIENIGISRKTLMAALKAEGVGAGPYVPHGLHQWKRLHWQDYTGPKPFWMGALEAAGTNYQDQQLPNCDYKVAHSLEISFNNYREVDAPGMQRMANAFHKINENLSELEDWQHQQEADNQDDYRAVTAAKRAADAYAR